MPLQTYCTSWEPYFTLYSTSLAHILMTRMLYFTNHTALHPVFKVFKIQLTYEHHEKHCGWPNQDNLWQTLLLGIRTSSVVSLKDSPQKAPDHMCSNNLLYPNDVIRKSALTFKSKEETITMMLMILPAPMVICSQQSWNTMCQNNGVSTLSP